MGYAHIFYGVKLDSLRALWGSKQHAIVSQVLKKLADDIENNDLFFEDQIEAGTCPDTKTALNEILAGAVSCPIQPAMYGYALKLICEHVGKEFGDEVAAVRDHPYESQLISSGPPLPIPYRPENFPQIGYLALADIPAELSRIDSAPRAIPHTSATPDRDDFESSKEYYAALRDALQDALTSKASTVLLDNESLMRDTDNFRTTLQEALDRRFDIVSFRH